MQSIVFSILSVFIVGLAFLGYGKALSRAFFQKIEITWGQKTLLGFAIFISLSGYVELFKIGSVYLFWIYLFIGIIFGLYTFKKFISNSPIEFKFNYLKIIATIFVSIITLLYLTNLIFLPFNHGDDYTSYLVFPIRVLIEGYQGGDPFNQRGIEQGFGGGGSINALFLSLIPLAHLHIAETGTGLLLLFGLAIGHIYYQNPRFWPVLGGIVVTLILSIFIQSTNIAPILSGCALAYGVMLLFIQSTQMPPAFSYQRAIFLGILLAALLLLKGSLFVPMVVFGGSFYIARLLQIQKWWVIQEAFVTVTALTICLAPWLISNELYHQTPFYPLLGRGLSYSGGFSFVTSPEMLNALGEFVPLYCLLIICGMLFVSYSNSSSQQIFTSVMIFLVILSTTVLSLTPAGMYRYNYVILATPSAFLLNSFLSNPNKSFINPIPWLSPNIFKKILIFFIVITMILMAHQTKRVGRNFLKEGLYSRYLNTPINLSVNDFLSPEFENERKRYVELQNAIPPGDILLVQVTSPFMLDFSRNQIYIMDYPGNAGPKPGPPFNKSSEELAQYLRNNKIRYVAHAYAYWNQQKFDPYFIDNCLNAAGEWGRTLAIRQLLTNEQMLDLAKNYRVLFDDQHNRIIDLLTPIVQSQSK